MSNFNIQEDLEFRSDDQTLNIIAISGPTAQRVMQDLVDQNYDWIKDRFGVVVNPVVADHIVQQYAGMILR